MAYNDIPYRHKGLYFVACRDSAGDARGELFLTLISKNTYGFRNADRRKMLDPNTRSRRGGDRKGYPTFMSALRILVGCLRVEMKGRRSSIANNLETQYYSRHWTLLLQGDAAGGDISPQAGN